MDSLKITKTQDGFNIEGFPDAVKVILIEGPKTKRLADLALHKADLKFALECLDGINMMAEQPFMLRQALWRSAIVHFMKCFGKNETRFSLDPRAVYKADVDALEAFNFFDNLRNKHIVHDENSYAQCLPGAVLNKKDADYKIAKIVCLSVIGDTLEQSNYNNLHLLISLAQVWVVSEFNQLCGIITAELEIVPYSDLLKRESVKFTSPRLEEIGKKKNLL